MPDLGREKGSTPIGPALVVGPCVSERPSARPALAVQAADPCVAPLRGAAWQGVALPVFLQNRPLTMSLPADQRLGLPAERVRPSSLSLSPSSSSLLLPLLLASLSFPSAKQGRSSNRAGSPMKRSMDPRESQLIWEGTTWPRACLSPLCCSSGARARVVLRARAKLNRGS